MASIKEEIRRRMEKENKVNDNAEFKSTHNLPFETAPHFMPEFVNYRVGTCTGIYCYNEKCYMILAVGNDKEGNGHLEDVFDWFINSCIRDKKHLMVLEVWNERFKKHLIEKRGFIPSGEEHVIKFYDQLIEERKLKNEQRKK